MKKIIIFFTLILLALAAAAFYWSIKDDQKSFTEYFQALFINGNWKITLVMVCIASLAAICAIGGSPFTAENKN